MSTKLNYEGFLNLLKPVSEYAIDQLPNDQPDVDIDQRSLSISNNLFYNMLYENRPYLELELLNRLMVSNDLLCLVGSKGAGKTSTASYIANSIHNKPNIDIYIIDIRQLSEIENLSNKSANKIMNMVKSHIINLYLRKRFNEYSDELELWSFLLEDIPAKYKPTNIFSMFAKIESEAKSYLRKFKGINKERKDSKMKDMLKEWGDEDDYVSNLICRLRKKLKLEHLVYATRYIHNKTRQIIWIDNIDRIEETKQGVLVDLLRKYYILIKSYVSVAIAIREQNVIRYYDLADEEAPPYASTVFLEWPESILDRKSYTSIDIQVINDNKFTSLLKRRLTFTKGISDNIVKRIISNEDLDKYKPLPDDKQYGKITQISDKLLKAILDEKGIYLANNSIRDLLQIHRDCLKLFLSLSEKIGPAKFLKIEQYYYVTLYLRWLKNAIRHYRWEFFDVVDITEQWFRYNKNSLGCFLPYLVMTAIWNYSIELNKQRLDIKLPTIGQIIERMSELNVNEKKIREIILALHYRDGSRGHIIEIRDNTSINTKDKLDDNHMVYLTFRGKALITRIMHSFGYLSECVRDRDVTYQGESKLHDWNQGILDNAEYVAEIMLPSLCDIAQMHCETLINIRNSKFSSKTNNWYEKYLEWFGMPIVKPYRDDNNIGIVINKVRRVLCFEGMLNRVNYYLVKNCNYNKVTNLQNSFNLTVNKIRNKTETANDVNFRKLLSIEERH